MDSIVEFVKKLALGEPTIRLVKLFGSRARGDHKPRSDYDFAISAPTMTQGGWARWKTNVQELAPTLCGLDLVWIEQLSDQNLLGAIDREGVVIYEKN